MGLPFCNYFRKIFFLILLNSSIAWSAFIPPPALTGGGAVRSIPVSYITYINSNANDSAIYVNLTISNLSDVQVIVNKISLTISVYYYNMSTGAFEVKTPPAFDRYIVVSNGNIGTPTRTALPEELPAQASMLFSTVYTPRRTQLYINLTTPPYIGQSLTNFTNIINGNDYGGGDYIGYLMISGKIEVSDQNNKPGFLFAYGSVIKPSSMGTANTATSSSFVLNGGKPL